MKVAVNKATIGKIKDFGSKEYVYIFDDETLDELVKLNLHCVHKDYAWKIKDLKIPFKKDYKFAIIVPSFNNNHGEYNGKTYLRNCIDSILGQTYKNFELIIVDDMSTDNSVETVESYVDKRIHLIKNTRKRYNGGSRNVGIDYAFNNLDFDYFCFLDSDDWWKNTDVLRKINSMLYEHEMLTISCEMVGDNGVMYTSLNKPLCYEDLYSINNNLWCTAWARVIRKDKMVYFCEDTLMEDRVWTYRLADNLDFNKVTTLEEVCYCWNRMNRTTSVSITRNDFWNASAYCHIGHQLQLLSQLKHKEMIPILEERLKQCIKKVNNKIYEQY